MSFASHLTVRQINDLEQRTIQNCREYAGKDAALVWSWIEDLMQITMPQVYTDGYLAGFPADIEEQDVILLNLVVYHKSIKQFGAATIWFWEVWGQHDSRTVASGITLPGAFAYAYQVSDWLRKEFPTAAVLVH